VQAEERRQHRARLKVFLGYAPRVGKSYRMFAEGRRRAERGEDVVVGAVQGKPTPEIQEILSRLEAVPPLIERHAGRIYEVMDLAAIFRRHPSVCLIDGLAYDNPPGSRNPQRWQDVRDLLDRGIAVITAVNLQHIREKQTEVERITGKHAAYSVPEEFLLDADEIEVVDAQQQRGVAHAIGGLDFVSSAAQEFAQVGEHVDIGVDAQNAAACGDGRCGAIGGTIEGIESGFLGFVQVEDVGKARHLEHVPDELRDVAELEISVNMASAGERANHCAETAAVDESDFAEMEKDGAAILQQVGNVSAQRFTFRASDDSSLTADDGDASNITSVERERQESSENQASEIGTL